MHVALVSDTHLPRFGRSLPQPLLEGFAAHGVDHILHAGDWTEALAVDLFEAVAPIDGVAGNNDGPAIRRRFSEQRIVELAGVRIGLTHGHLGPGRTTPERAQRAFEGEESLAAIVFGHSHAPFLQRLPSGIWLVNPGSPTDRRAQPAYSWALMTLDVGRIVGVEIIRFVRPSTTGSLSTPSSRST